MPAFSAASAFSLAFFLLALAFIHLSFAFPMSVWPPPCSTFFHSTTAALRAVKTVSSRAVIYDITFQINLSLMYVLTLRLCRHRDQPRPSDPWHRSRLDRIRHLLAGDGDGGRRRPLRASVRALHFLSPSPGKRLVLRRRVSADWWLNDLGRVDGHQYDGLEARESRPSGAACDVRDHRDRVPVGVGGVRRPHRTRCHIATACLRLERSARRRARADAVLRDAARHRLFLVDAGLYRVLHTRAAGRRWAPLQRYPGAAHLHHVPALCNSRRDASPPGRSRARIRIQIRPIVSDLSRLVTDAGYRLFDVGQSGDRRPRPRRSRAVRMASGAPLGRADDARGRIVARDARPGWFRRARQYELWHECDDPQYRLDPRPFSSDLRRHGRDHVFRHRLRDVAADYRQAVAFQASRVLAALGLVLGHADHHDPLAYRRPDGAAAAGGDV